MHESPQVLRTARLILSVPPPEHAPQVLRFYDENRAALQRWDPPRHHAFYTPDFLRDRTPQPRGACRARHGSNFLVFPSCDP